MLKLSLDAIEIIDAIDRGGSFAAAAEALHKVPSTISYTVSKLEEQLGFDLFARRGPRVSLTPAGRELLAEGRWLLRSAADLESRLRRIATGYESELRLVHDSLLPVSALVGHIRDFEALDCGTRLRISTEVMTGAWEALREGRAEIVLAVGDPPPGFAQHAKRLRAIEFVFCVAPGHPLARLDRPVTEEDLLAHTAIVVADSARLLPARSVREGDPISVRLSAFDPNGDEVRFESPNLPQGAQLNPLTGLLQWTPAYTQAGSYDIALWATDGMLRSETIFHVEVTNVNGVPVFVMNASPVRRTA